MNRRELLAGFLGTAVAAIIGPVPALVESTAPINAAVWEAAVAKVMATYFEDLCVFGTAAIRYTEIFPFIENVDPSTLPAIDHPNVYKELLLLGEADVD